MVQYINKTALVAKIEKRINFNERLNAYPRLDECNEILSFINTTEVKDVDLEKEINKYISDNFFGSQTMGFFSNRTKEEPNDQDIALCAKHFYELGLKVSNPITATDRGTAEEIIISLKRVEEDYCLDLTREIEWLRNKVKKGD